MAVGRDRMLRVLVADDSELDLQLTRRALKKALPEWEIDAVEDGVSAERMLAAEAPPELVLLDFRMPGKGAIDILSGVSPEVVKTVPFVLFSSSVSPTDVARCEGLGVREYVEKPTDPTEYNKAIEGICRRWAKGLAS